MTASRWEPRHQERRGRPRTGLFPYASRTFISEVTGIRRPAVSAVLNGTRGISLSGGVVLARVLGISPERLERDLRALRSTRQGWTTSRPMEFSESRPLVPAA